LDLQLPMQSVPITTDVVSLNIDQGEVYNIYVTKFVSNLWQVDGFLRILRFPPPIKLIAMIYNWNITESGVKHHKTKPIE
jgi:hypothetical protein